VYSLESTKAVDVCSLESTKVDDVCSLESTKVDDVYLPLGKYVGRYSIIIRTVFI